MPTIYVKNTCIEVHDYKWGSCTQLENNFRKFDPITFSNKYIGVHYDPEKKILFLPRGMDIWYVEKLLDAKANIVKDYNPIQHCPDMMLKALPRDDTQREALRFMMGRGDHSYTSTRSQLGVFLNTGKGKTYVSVATFAHCKIKPIIIATQSDWLKQWAACIKDYTNIRDNEICVVSSTWMYNVILRGTYPAMYKHKVFLATHSTIRNFADRYGWEKLNDFFKLAGIGMKVFDECHTDFTNLCMIDFYTNVCKTYYVSASPSRTDDKEKQIYEGVYMRNIPSITLFDPNQDPHTDYLAIQYSTDPSPMEISKCRNAYGLDRNKYMSITIRNERFKMMATIAMNMAINKMAEYGDEAQCLIYIGLNEAITEFMDYIPLYVPAMKDNMGVYTSISSPAEKQLARSKKFILTTTKSAAACVDIKNLRVVIVMCEPFASNIIAQQSIGRLRNPDTLYIELVDTGFKQIQRFYAKKLPVFRKYAKSVTRKSVSEYQFEALFEKAYEKLHAPVEQPVVEYVFEWKYVPIQTPPTMNFAWQDIPIQALPTMEFAWG